MAIYASEMSCPFRGTCVVFSAIQLDERLEYLAWAFCHTIYADCCRYKKTVAGEYIPEDLMPTGEMISRRDLTVGR